MTTPIRLKPEQSARVVRLDSHRSLLRLAKDLRAAPDKAASHVLLRNDSDRLAALLPTFSTVADDIRARARDLVLEVVNAPLPADQSVAIRAENAVVRVVHIYERGCADCGGAGKGETCPKHGGGCDCDAVEVECQSCGGIGDYEDEDCACLGCATVAEMLDAEAGR